MTWTWPCWDLRHMLSQTCTCCVNSSDLSALTAQYSSALDLNKPTWRVSCWRKVCVVLSLFLISCDILPSAAHGSAINLHSTCWILLDLVKSLKKKGRKCGMCSLWVNVSGCRDVWENVCVLEKATEFAWLSLKAPGYMTQKTGTNMYITQTHTHKHTHKKKCCVTIPSRQTYAIQHLEEVKSLHWWIWSL